MKEICLGDLICAIDWNLQPEADLDAATQKHSVIESSKGWEYLVTCRQEELSCPKIVAMCIFTFRDHSARVDADGWFEFRLSI